MKKWIVSFWSLFFPPCCVVCGRVLLDGEAHLCTSCNMDMPRTYFHLQEGNVAEQLFWGRIPIVRAASYFFYTKGSRFKNLLYDLKYHDNKELGYFMGRNMAKELQPTAFFEGIDVILPVPLHPARKRKRGYNQSELIARGVSHVSGVPVDVLSLYREVNSSTQTRKSTFERWENVEKVFALHPSCDFSNKHILLVDDVLTTGSTLVACASLFASYQNVRISVLSLGMAA